jgi:hypothetical protein
VLTIPDWINPERVFEVGILIFPVSTSIHPVTTVLSGILLFCDEIRADFLVPY